MGGFKMRIFLFISLLLAFLTLGAKAQETFSASEETSTDKPTVENGTDIENDDEDTSRPQRSIGKLTRLLLGGTYVMVQLGQMPPEHPLVRYPNPVHKAQMGEVISALPGSSVQAHLAGLPNPLVASSGFGASSLAAHQPQQSDDGYYVHEDIITSPRGSEYPKAPDTPVTNEGSGRGFSDSKYFIPGISSFTGSYKSKSNTKSGHRVTKAEYSSAGGSSPAGLKQQPQEPLIAKPYNPTPSKYNSAIKYNSPANYNSGSNYNGPSNYKSQAKYNAPSNYKSPSNYNPAVNYNGPSNYNFARNPHSQPDYTSPQNTNSQPDYNYQQKSNSQTDYNSQQNTHSQPNYNYPRNLNSRPSYNYPPNSNSQPNYQTSSSSVSTKTYEKQEQPNYVEPAPQSNKDAQPSHADSYAESEVQPGHTEVTYSEILSPSGSQFHFMSGDAATAEEPAKSQSYQQQSYADSKLKEVDLATPASVIAIPLPHSKPPRKPKPVLKPFSLKDHLLGTGSSGEATYAPRFPLKSFGGFRLPNLFGKFNFHGDKHPPMQPGGHAHIPGFVHQPGHPKHGGRHGSAPPPHRNAPAGSEQSFSYTVAPFLIKTGVPPAPQAQKTVSSAVHPAPASLENPYGQVFNYPPAPKGAVDYHRGQVAESYPISGYSSDQTVAASNYQPARTPVDAHPSPDSHYPSTSNGNSAKGDPSDYPQDEPKHSPDMENVHLTTAHPKRRKQNGKERRGPHRYTTSSPSEHLPGEMSMYSTSPSPQNYVSSPPPRDQHRSHGYSNEHSTSKQRPPPSYPSRPSSSRPSRPPPSLPSRPPQNRPSRPPPNYPSRPPPSYPSRPPPSHPSSPPPRYSTGPPSRYNSSPPPSAPAPTPYSIRNSIPPPEAPTMYPQSPTSGYGFKEHSSAHERSRSKHHHSKSKHHRHRDSHDRQPSQQQNSYERHPPQQDSHLAPAGHQPSKYNSGHPRQSGPSGQETGHPTSHPSSQSTSSYRPEHEKSGSSGRSRSKSRHHRTRTEKPKVQSKPFELRRDFDVTYDRHRAHENPYELRRHHENPYGMGHKFGNPYESHDIYENVYERRRQQENSEQNPVSQSSESAQREQNLQQYKGTSTSEKRNSAERLYKPKAKYSGEKHISERGGKDPGNPYISAEKSSKYYKTPGNYNPPEEIIEHSEIEESRSLSLEDYYGNGNFVKKTLFLNDSDSTRAPEQKIQVSNWNQHSTNYAPPPVIRNSRKAEYFQEDESENQTVSTTILPPVPDKPEDNKSTEPSTHAGDAKPVAHDQLGNSAGDSKNKSEKTTEIQKLSTVNPTKSPVEESIEEETTTENALLLSV